MGAVDRPGGTPVLAGIVAALLVAGLCSAVVVGGRTAVDIGLTVPVPNDAALAAVLPAGAAESPAAAVEVPPSTTPTTEQPAAAPAAAAPDPAAGPYAGLGAWVDVFDYAPVYGRPAEGPQLGLADLDAMAARGVRTLYLQAARLDERSPGGVVDPGLVGQFLRRAHERGMRVVGWYLPRFADLETDLTNLRRIRDLRHRGHRFDGIAVDIEYRRDVPDDAERTRRLLELSRTLRAEAGGLPLGAVVYPPSLLEDWRPRFWPGFPWRELAASYDVWLPMAYWTEAGAASGYRYAPYRYAKGAVERIRANLGDPSARVHVIGGVADDATLEELAGFGRAAEETGVVGWSVYDSRTTSAAGWEVLGRPAG